MKALVGWLFAVFALVSACGRDGGGTAQSDVQVASFSTGLPAFARGDARLTVAHSGIRRLEFAPITGSGISFRERIITDGQGRYSIEALSLIESSTLDWEFFAMLQQSREGFHFRYRDFHVHDPLLFVRNWRLTDLGPTASIAGRACKRYRVVRTQGSRVAYEISVDSETGLVLSSDQYDERGQLIASMVYESFQLDPALGGVAWHQPSNQERLLDAQVDLATQLAFLPLLPRLLPGGYSQVEAALVTEAPRTEWLKLTYSDGIQSLFLLQVHREPAAGRVAQPGSLTPAGLPKSSVASYQLGAATVIQGQVEGFSLIVIGMVPEVELLDMIESSLP